jgi:hypothetical protein
MDPIKYEEVGLYSYSKKQQLGCGITFLNYGPHNVLVSGWRAGYVTAMCLFLSLFLLSANNMQVFSVKVAMPLLLKLPFQELYGLFEVKSTKAH